MTLPPPNPALRACVIVPARDEELEQQVEVAGLVLEHVLEARDEDVEDVVDGLRGAERLVEPRDPDLGVAAHDLDAAGCLYPFARAGRTTSSAAATIVATSATVSRTVS